MQPTQKITYMKLVRAVSGQEYRTLQSIGNEFGVTRERIRQLINQHNLRTAPARQIPDRRQNCNYCGELVEARNVNRKYGKKYYVGKQYDDNHKSCSIEYHESLWLTIPCSQCNKDIRIRRKDRRLKVRKMDYLFCSHSCAAIYRIENATDNFAVWAKSSKGTMVRKRK